MNQKPLKYAFRITHIDNVPHIMEHGITAFNSPNKNEDFIGIGDTQIIDMRKELFFNGIRLSDCIPFYFGPRSPMLYVIQHGYNGVKRLDPAKIVYCVLRLSDIIESCLDCIFTNGHALSALTEFFTKESLSDIDSIIDYSDVYAKFWISDSDLDLKRRKEAELLIKNDIPPKYIRGFVVYNDKAKSVLRSYGIADSLIEVAPNYYF